MSESLKSDLNIPPDVLKEMSLEELTATHVRLKNAHSTISSQFNAVEKIYKNDMEFIRAEMSTKLTAAGLTSAKTAAGTVSYRNTTRAICNDWPAFHEHVRQNPEYLVGIQQRLSSKAIEELVERDGKLPPGVLIDQLRNVIVAKPRATSSTLTKKKS